MLTSDAVSNLKLGKEITFPLIIQVISIDKIQKQKLK